MQTGGMPKKWGQPDDKQRPQKRKTTDFGSKAESEHGHVMSVKNEFKKQDR